MAQRILTRSPFYISDTSAPQLEIDIWVGIKNDTYYTGDAYSGIPTWDPEYTVKSKQINGRIDIDISPLVKDFIDNNFYLGNYPADGIWVYVRRTPYNAGGFPVPETTVTTYAAYNGYTTKLSPTHPNEDVSYTESADGILQFYYGDVNRIALGNQTATVLFKKNGIPFKTQSITRSNDTTDSVKYIGHTPQFEGDVDQIEIVSTTHGYTQTYDVKVNYACPNVPEKLTYVNKQGVYQDIFFYGQSKEVMNTTEVNYSSKGTGAPYAIRTEHERKTLFKNSIVTTTLNTGLVPESFNNILADLLVSERVWSYNGGETNPVLILSNNIDFKKQANSELGSYEITIQKAFNEVNSAR